MTDAAQRKAIIFKHVCALGCESIVSKRLDSLYHSGRVDLAPPNRGGLNSTHIQGTHGPVEEPSEA
jgi:hypothetical protein